MRVYCAVSRVFMTFALRGETALHKGASQRQHTVCRMLVDAGASLTKVNFQVT